MKFSLLYLVVGSLTFVESARPVFKSDATEHIEAGFKTVRRNTESQIDFSKIEVTTQPRLMVKDPDSFDADRVTLEIKTGSGPWRAVPSQPKVRGGVYRWTVEEVEPCRDTGVRLLLRGQEGDQAVLQLPAPVLRATPQQLLDSHFVPARPGRIIVEEATEDSVTVSWEVSACAEMYDVTYEAMSGEGESRSQQVKGDSMRLEGLRSCTEYEVRVSALLGQEYSEEAQALVSTSPGFYAAEKLSPVLTATSHSLTATWRAFELLSCVTSYTVAVCEEGRACPPGSLLGRDDARSQLLFVSGDVLDQCTDYTIHITPMFKGNALEEKILPFRTLSSPVGHSASLLTKVQAEAREEQMVSVRWDRVQCASQYQVFQRLNTPGGEWERIGATKENTFTSKGVPCTEYKYGVKVTIDDEESEVVEFKEAILTKIDTSVPYVAANLAILPTPDGAQLTWDHGRCIKSYKIRACELLGGEERCFEEAVIIEDPGMHKMVHLLRNLKPCSKHQLEIFPLTEEDTELAAEPSIFLTGSLPPSPPEQVRVELNTATNKVDISWSRVQCALGYRIHQTLENSDTETKWDCEGTEVSLESPEPCVTYSYGVSAMVGEEESRPTERQKVAIPPRVGHAEQPILIVEEKNNGSVTFVINKADKNHHCKVAQYHVKYNSIDQLFEASSLEGGRMTVEIPEVDGKIEGRILYQDFDTWSPWISSDSPKQEAVGAGMDLVLLIVFGAVAACVVTVVLVIVVILRQKKSQRKYDAEKAAGSSEESKKLNNEKEEKS